MAEDPGTSSGAELRRGVDVKPGKPASLKLGQDEDGAPDSHLAEWVRAPAKYIKKANGGRRLQERTAIDQVTIHTLVTDLTAAAWVEKVRAGTTSKNDIPHYVVGTTIPCVYQVAREKYIVWHASAVNDSAIGIEHQGRANDPKYYPPSLYRRSAELVREICQRRNIPIDRQHIRGHQELTRDGHDDPGGYWDWEYYIALINDQRPIRMILGEEEPCPIGDDKEMFSSIGDLWKADGWRQNKGTREGPGNGPRPQHSYGSRFYDNSPLEDDGQTRDEPAIFEVQVADGGKYRVDGWWPIRSENNSATTIRVFAGAFAVGGETPAAENLRITRTVSQSSHAGRTWSTPSLPSTPKWGDIGELTITAGDTVRVEVSRLSNQRGRVVADAFRLLRLEG